MNIQNNRLNVINVCTEYTQIGIKVIPSYNCDLNCSYCYNKNVNENYYLENLDNILKTLDGILLRKDLNVIVDIIGGEPLSNKTFSTTEKIIDHLIYLKKNTKIVLQTGTPNIERITKLIPKIDVLSYSMDLSESPKAFNIKNMEKISETCRDYGVLIQILTTLSLKDNVETICQFIENCTLYGIRWIGMVFPEYQLYTKEQLDKQICVYFELLKRLNNFKDITVGGIMIESVLDFLQGKKYFSRCICGERSVVIQPDGSITPSIHFELNKSLSLENFNIIKFQRRSMLENNECAGCKIWNICLGGCMGHANFIAKDFLQPDKEFCYVLSGIINKLKSEPI